MIVTHQQLFKDYDRKCLPLALSVVSKTDYSGYGVRYLYFNGEQRSDGCCRIFCKLYLPINYGNKAIMVMDDIENGVDAFDAMSYVKKGYAVLVIDYAGENENTSRFTIYPKSLSFAKYYQNKNCISTIPSVMNESCWYIWALAAFRGVTFLESEGFDKIGFIGVGEGGHQVYKVAAQSNTLAFGAVKFSGFQIKNPETGDPGNAFIAYKAALDDTIYAPYLKAPVFMQVTSNEQNSSLDEMNSTFMAGESVNTYFSISERSDRTLNKEQRNNIEKFVDFVFSEIPLIKSPKVTAKASEKNLYYNITVFNSEEVEKVTFFAAHSQKKSAFRNWRACTTEKTGESDYIARIAVYSAKEPVYAFCNVLYKNGFSLSSAVNTVIPSQLGVEAVVFTQKRRIYDIDMGISEWIMLGSSLETDCLKMQEGPFSISGVTSTSNRISTFALADKLYSGNADSALQLIIYSFDTQEITFSITDAFGSVYTCKKTVTPSENWAKLTLALSNFRSNEKLLPSWQNIVTFEISGSKSFLINSLLWV